MAFLLIRVSEGKRDAWIIGDDLHAIFKDLLNKLIPYVVRMPSNTNTTAFSPVGPIGLTQPQELAGQPTDESEATHDCIVLPPVPGIGHSKLKAFESRPSASLRSLIRSCAARNAGGRSLPDAGEIHTKHQSPRADR